MLFDKKALKKLIFPLMAEQLLAVLVGLVDTLMVSQAGEAAISGVALVDNINRLVIQMMAALATGGAVVCSQYIGKKTIREAKRTAAQLELVLTVFAVLMMSIALLATRSLLHAVFGGVSEDVMSSAVTYFTITAMSFPFLGIYNAGAAIFRSSGNSRISMELSLLMNILNVIGDAVFVFVFHWAVFGVALSTLISRGISGLVMTMLVCGKKNPIRIERLRQLIPQGALIRKILTIGIPSGIENAMFQIGKLSVTSMIATFGTASIAANSISYTIVDFANIPGSAMGLALITVVGQCVGAGRKDQATAYTKKLVKYAYFGDWICNILLFTLAGWLASGFHLSTEAHGIAVMILQAFAVTAMLIWPLSFTLSNALRAAGDVTFTMSVSILSMWVFRVGSSYFFGVVLGMGVMGVWIGMFIDWAARSALFGWRFLSGRWLNRKSLV